MNQEELIEKVSHMHLNDGDIIVDENSACCNAPIKYTDNSGVYIRPGAYCSKCHNLIV